MTKQGKVKRLQQEHEATHEAMAKDIQKPIAAIAVPMLCQFASSFLTPICRKRIAASVQISMPSCGFPSLVICLVCLGHIVEVKARKITDYSGIQFRIFI
jgi:hypothetical protein